MLAITLRSLRIGGVCIRKPIRHIFVIVCEFAANIFVLHSQGYSPQCESSIIIMFYGRTFRNTPVESTYSVRNWVMSKYLSPLLPFRNNSDLTGLCSKRSGMRGMNTWCHLANMLALLVKISVPYRWAILLGTRRFANINVTWIKSTLFTYRINSCSKLFIDNIASREIKSLLGLPWVYGQYG